MATEPSRLEANRLYWETEASVGNIAETLGISRRALYDLLERIPAPEPCPECGGPLLFANRLARSTGEAQCGACAATTTLPPTHPRSLELRLAEAAARSGNGADDGDEGLYPLPPFPAPPAPAGLAALVRDRGVQTLAAVALAGLVLGVGVTLLVTRDRR